MNIAKCFQNFLKTLLPNNAHSSQLSIMKVLEMELSLKARQDSLQKEMSTMSTRLQKTREDTNQEVIKILIYCSNIRLLGEETFTNLSGP